MPLTRGEKFLKGGASENEIYFQRDSIELGYFSVVAWPSVDNRGFIIGYGAPWDIAGGIAFGGFQVTGLSKDFRKVLKEFKYREIRT